MLNDYKGLKLIASSNPHIRNNEDTRSIMLDVIIALCPALIMSVIRFGFRALISVLVSVVSAMFFEWLYRKLMHKTQTLGDLSAAVTGVLLAFVCPVTLPYWMLIVGNFFAIFVVKQLYGGLGKNFLNTVAHFDDRYIECTAAQVVNHDLLILFLINTVRKCSGCWLIDDSLNCQTCDLTGVLSSLSLCVCEVSRNCYNSLCYLFAQISLSVSLQLLKYHS